MTNLTTPKAILIGLSFIAFAIASLPFTSSLIPSANAQSGLTKVQICDPVGGCAAVDRFSLRVTAKY